MKIVRHYRYSRKFTHSNSSKKQLLETFQEFEIKRIVFLQLEFSLKNC